MEKLYKKFLFVPSIIFLAFLLRIWNFTSIGLWHDEAFSALLIRMPFSEMMHRIALDVHPPFYYWLLRAWSAIFGFEIGSLRGFSVFFGVATVLMMYIFIKKLTQSRMLACGASALLAVNAFHIQYSLEARMYTLGTFLVLLTSWLLIKAINENKWVYWTFYGIFIGFSALTHYFLLFSIIAQGIFILFWYFKNKNIGLKWIYSYFLSLLIFLPWLPTFLKQVTQVEESYWIPKMEAFSIPSTIWKITLGGFESAEQKVILIISALVLSITIYYFYKSKNTQNIYIIFAGFIPFALAILISLKNSLYLDRYFIFASLFITAIIAISLLSFKYKRLGISILSVFILFNMIYYSQAYNKLDVDEKPGMREASRVVLDQYLVNCESHNDKVYVSSTFIYFTYQYYYQLYLDKPSGCKFGLAPKPKLYLEGINKVSDLPHFSGTALLENDDLSDLVLTDGSTAWLIWTTGFGGSKPKTPNNWKEIEETNFTDVFDYKGKIFVTKYILN